MKNLNLNDQIADLCAAFVVIFLASALFAGIFILLIRLSGESLTKPL